MTKLNILVKQLGKKYPLLEDKEITIDYHSPNISVENLIRNIVRQQVSIFNKKIKENNKEELDNPDYFLLNNGKIGFGKLYNDKFANLEKSENVAIQAFEDGLYNIFYGDKEIKNLSDNIDLSFNKTLTFIRLTFLSGSIW